MHKYSDLWLDVIEVYESIYGILNFSACVVEVAEILCAIQLLNNVSSLDSKVSVRIGRTREWKQTCGISLELNFNSHFSKLLKL